MIDPSMPYGRCSDAEESLVGDRMMIYHRRTGRALVLNPTGSWLWQNLVKPMSAVELAECLERRYAGLSPEQARDDVIGFLQSLLEQELLLPAPTPSSSRTDGVS